MPRRQTQKPRRRNARMPRRRPEPEVLCYRIDDLPKMLSIGKNAARTLAREIGFRHGLRQILITRAALEAWLTRPRPPAAEVPDIRRSGKRLGRPRKTPAPPPAPEVVPTPATSPEVTP